MYTALVELEDSTKMSYELMVGKPSDFTMCSDTERKLRTFLDSRKVKSVEIVPLYNKMGYSLNEVYSGCNQR